ncbi:helix-hairpin-helix domain-containing protein [Bacteroides sp.]
MKNTWTLRLFLIINFLLIMSVNNAQTPSINLLDDVMEDISVNNDEGEDVNWENIIEELSERIQQPVNLNTATKEQLEQFPFLTDIQIENLLAYVYINGQMQTIYELQLVEEMDRETIRYLLPFVCVQPVDKKQLFPQLKDVIKYGKHEVLTRMDVPFYTRKGYEKTYLGPSVYHSLRYSFHYKDNIYAGVTGEKDAGEPFGALHDKQGYDYYSYYLFISGMGRLKTLALGNYRLSFGQGLVMSTDFIMGKSTYLSSFTFRNKGIRKHSSTDEYNYFRGAAAAIELTKHFVLSAFYSHRTMDGVVQDNEITSIYKTGLHRSQKEADKKNAFALQLTGGNITYTNNHLKLGLTGIYYFFNHPFEPDLRQYSKYNLRGNDFYNVGLEYGYRWHRFSFQGEAAVGKKGFAVLNKLQYSLVQGVHLLLIHRYYAHDYWAMFARSFGESSSVQNENGWYLGGEIAPFRRWKLFASIDLFSFPWWKYRISKPSQGVDGLLQVTFVPYKNLTMYLNYRYKQKERDVTGTKGEVTLPTYHHRLRYRLNYSLGDLFSFRTTADYNHFHSSGESSGQGYQVTQMISCRIPHIPLVGELQGSYFHTDDYDTRVYIAEKGLLYTFYTPSFEGKGIRMAINLRYDLNAHWMVIARFGQTVYQDRNEIGSGNDLISSNKKADLQMQLRLKF